jgi:hypothetical protein
MQINKIKQQLPSVVIMHGITLFPDIKNKH